MTPFEAYGLFIATKLHFTSPKYNMIKYQGKFKSDPRSFERRRDKHFFGKLSRHRDPLHYLVANFVDRDPKWIGDVFSEDSEDVYTKWLARQQSLTYNFKKELADLEGDFKQYFTVTNGQHPLLLKKLYQHEISIETFIMLNNLLSFNEIWSKRVADTILWPATEQKCLKYAPFIKYDRDKIKSIVKDKIRDK